MNHSRAIDRHNKNQAPTNLNQVKPEDNHVKQFLFLRKDLKDFSTGALVAQGCHAAIVAIEKSKEDTGTMDYLGLLEDMTTVVYGICEKDMCSIMEGLDSFGVKYHLWLENRQIPTCIATAPVDLFQNKSFDKFRKKFRLF